MGMKKGSIKKGCKKMKKAFWKGFKAKCFKAGTACHKAVKNKKFKGLGACKFACGPCKPVWPAYEKKWKMKKGSVAKGCKALKKKFMAKKWKMKKHGKSKGKGKGKGPKKGK